MPEEIRITVTEEHIKKGNPGHVCECPIALAIKEVVTDRSDISVTSTAIRVYDDHGGLERFYNIPTEAVFFMRAFDRIRGYDYEAHVRPFSFVATRSFYL